MKIILFLLLMLVNIKSAFSQAETNPITVSLTLEKEYSKAFSRSEFWVKESVKKHKLNINTDSVIQHFYDVKIELKNTSDIAVCFWNYDCLWTSIFCVNNDYIFLSHPGCDQNLPILNKLEPNSTMVYRGTISKSIKFNYPCDDCSYRNQVRSTKIGLVLIDNISDLNLRYVDYLARIEDKSMQSIIWSSGIDLLGKQE